MLTGSGIPSSRVLTRELRSARLPLTHTAVVVVAGHGPVAVRARAAHNVADIKLKKNSLEENKSLLGTKLSELSIKEKAIMKQLIDVKNYLITKIEAR